MRYLPSSLFLFSIIVLAAGGCSTYGQSLTTCDRDSDCDDREICVGKTCQVVECTRSSECPTGYTCQDNECVSLSECVSDGDCGADERCEQGTCVPDVGCQTDADCDAWERCDRGVCVLAGDCVTDADCDAHERCENGACALGNRCVDDGDCQMPLPTCDPRFGICVDCLPDCTGRCCGGDGCGGSCPDRCAQTGQRCDPLACTCEDICEPDCLGRECGPDGCGATCGPGCAGDEVCGADGRCTCTPQCAGRECGPDGCGGQCNPGCPAGEVCDADGRCRVCQPECGQRECGPDPICDSSCGTCPAGEGCNADGACVPACQSGETRCSADGFGYEACGPDPSGSGVNTFGPRIPCALGDTCQAGACARAHCLEAEVTIVLDRSSSMLAGGTWDWSTTGLMTKVEARQARNYFGYREFPSGGGCAVGGVLAMQKNNAQNIGFAMTDPAIDSATPIAAALQGFVQNYGDPNDGQAVILISDGDETCAGQAEALAAAGELIRAGVPVHVLALTQLANKAFLDQLAAAGGTGASRLVTDEAQLLTALEQVFQAIDACLCTAGTRCEAGEVWTCSADEMDLSLTESCPLGCAPAGETCQLCDVGERICMGNEIWRCQADRRDYVYESTCPDFCSQGACTTLTQFSGVQTDYPEADLGGWELCYSDTYANSGTSLSSILASCDGPQLLLACRPVGSPNLTLAAMGARADVTYECGQDQTCVHEHNGVGWYYSSSYSWGFAPAGEPVYRYSCDFNQDGNQTLPHLRMCWHTGGGAINGGYRCGDNDLNGDGGWERLIYHVP